MIEVTDLQSEYKNYVFIHQNKCLHAHTKFILVLKRKIICLYSAFVLSIYRNRNRFIWHGHWFSFLGSFISVR